MRGSQLQAARRLANVVVVKVVVGGSNSEVGAQREGASNRAGRGNRASETWRSGEFSK